mgnify:CR=1 FL=1
MSYILFSDKTGTITKGKLEAVGFVLVNDQNEDNLQEFRNIGDLPNQIQDDLNISIMIYI